MNKARHHWHFLVVFAILIAGVYICWRSRSKVRSLTMDVYANYKDGKNEEHTSSLLNVAFRSPEEDDNMLMT